MNGVRKLRVEGKSVAVVASGSEAQLPEGFEAPFRLTCGYLGMSYLGAHYCRFDNDAPAEGAKARASAFGTALFGAQAG